jgi:hypothetical protein
VIEKVNLNALDKLSEKIFVVSGARKEQRRFKKKRKL